MDWIKKQLTKPGTYIILFITSLVVPFIINDLYKYGLECERPYITMWNAADVLAFFGDYLSFFGTIILGAVAVFQTEKANEKTDDANAIATNALEQAERSNLLAQEALVQTERANELSAQMQKLEQAKFMSMIAVEKLYVNRHSISTPNCHTPGIVNPINFDMVDQAFWTFSHCYHIDVSFENISDYPIVELYGHAKGFNHGAKIRHGIKPASNTVYISPHEKQAIRFIIPSHFFEKYPQDGLRIDLEFVNVFDFHTFATIKIDALSKWMNSNVKKGYIYQIHKITDVKPQEDEETLAEEETIEINTET